MDKKKQVVAFGIIEMPGPEKRFMVVTDRDRPEPRLLKFPGGTAEIGENASEALFREMFEETCVNIFLDIKLVAEFDLNSHVVMFFFGRHYSGEPRPNNEVADLLLLTAGQIRAMISAGKFLRRHAQAFEKFVEIINGQVVA